MDTIELDKGTDSVLILVAASVYVCALGEHSTPPLLPTLPPQVLESTVTCQCTLKMFPQRPEGASSFS